MQIEMSCPSCFGGFGALPDSGTSEILTWMVEEGPFFALGDGETMEDRIHSRLTQRGPMECPQCGQPVAIDEESLALRGVRLWPPQFRNATLPGAGSLVVVRPATTGLLEAPKAGASL